MINFIINPETASLRVSLPTRFKVGAMSRINAVDLFCGVGGLTYGVKSAGINVIAGYDIDAGSRFPYEKNNDAGFILKDVKDINDREISALYPKDTDIKVLMGCAPCQPFSSYNRLARTAPARQEKMELLNYFGHQVNIVHPEIISMENVPQLAKENVFNVFLSLLRDEGYWVDWQIVFAPQYGVPQTRRRLLLLASRLGKIKLIPPTNDSAESYQTVRDAIGSLPAIGAGQTDENDNLHRARGLSMLNIQRIRASKPGGTWLDWDEGLRPEAYRAASGQSYKSVYGRLSWDKPSSTITTQFIGYGSGRFGHPEQDRALSLREGALLQTFPKHYYFVDPRIGSSYSSSQVALQIGNAVPPRLGKVIGKSIVSHVGSVLNQRG